MRPCWYCRALAKIALTATSAGTLKPLEGLASSGAVVARFQRLAQLSQSTLAAVVTAVALAANCSYSHYSSPSSTRVPSARLLASLRSPGLQEASCTWTVPGFLQLLEQAPPLPPEQRKLVSPAFGSGRRTWQLCVYPHGNAAELEEAVVSVYLANSLTWGCRARLSGTATFNLLDEVRCVCCAVLRCAALHCHCRSRLSAPQRPACATRCAAPRCAVLCCAVLLPLPLPRCCVVRSHVTSWSATRAV